MLYTFDDYTVDTRRATLWHAGQPIHLERLAFALLVYLLQHHDRVVLRQELLDHLWPDVPVGDAALEPCIQAVRDALEDSAQTPRYIQTVHRRGYRFGGTVEAYVLDPRPSPPPWPESGRRQAVRRTALRCVLVLVVVIGGLVSMRWWNGAPQGAPHVQQDAPQLLAASEPGLGGLDALPHGTYKLVELERTTRHLSPAVGFRATFRHPLLVPGNFDSLDKWDYSVHWGTVDVSQGWITSFAAQLPMTIVADGAGISFPKIVPYWQQILRRQGATQDASQWAEGDDFLYPSQVAQLFAPANRMPGTSVYHLASRVSVHGFDVAEGRVQIDDTHLTLSMELTVGNYIHTLVLKYRQ